MSSQPLEVAVRMCWKPVAKGDDVESRTYKAEAGSPDVATAIGFLSRSVLCCLW